MARKLLRTQRSNVVTLPAPYDGWNARDALTGMRPTDAIRLENFIPDSLGIRTRGGYAAHSTGAGSRVDSLMEYSGPAAIKLFAASGTKIYDVTATSTATNTATATFTNAQFQHVMMGTPAGAYLIICNGADAPMKFDGSAWSTCAITSASSSAFVSVTTHQSRLWFAQKDTLDAWYLPSSSIGGAADRLQLSPFCRKGGYLQAIASWTRDGGAGMDDQIVFITSEGEAIIYTGTDPTDSTLWAKVGTFNIPEPVGRRCVTQVGADLALITSQGVLPLSNILPLSPGGAAKVAATEKITNAFSEAYSLSSTFFGWQVIENSREKLLVVNVPQVEHATIVQFVMNTNTGAWGKFTGINANCWATKGDQLFFGGVNGTVYRYNASSLDAGSASIAAVVTTAFTDLGAPYNKQFQMVRAMLQGPEGLLPAVGVRVDYDTESLTLAGSAASGGGSTWDSSQWDSFQWGSDTIILREWQTVNGIGSAVSVEAQLTTPDVVRLNAIDLLFEVGGIL